MRYGAVGEIGGNWQFRHGGTLEWLSEMIRNLSDWLWPFQL